MGAFSLHQHKLLTSGEGAFVCTDDERLSHRLDALRNCGRDYFNPGNLSPDHFPQSGNYRCTEMQAALLNGGLARLDGQNATREANAVYLARMLSEVPGVTPQARPPQVTRQAYYGFAFRYDPSHFAGLSRDRFCRALRAEINYAPVAGPYEPLTRSPLYKPRTKRRHYLGEECWAAIDPRRFHLPECERAYEQVVVILHNFLLADRPRMEAVAEAVRKIQRHAGDLVRSEGRAA